MGTVLNISNEKFAQPAIAYHVKASTAVHLTSTAKMFSLTDKKEVRIVVPSEALPPSEMQDFAADFVGTQTKLCRTSLLKRVPYEMTVSMSEPGAVILQEQPVKVETMLSFSISIQDLATEYLPLSLHTLRFRITLVLRSKTFYSTSSFPMLPGQEMSSEYGPVRLHDQTTELATHTVSSGSWTNRPASNSTDAQYQSSTVLGKNGDSLLRQRSSTDSADTSKITQSSHSIWQTCLRLPVAVSGGYYPTFCSAHASRQYSIKARVQVKGVHVSDFALEVPLQIAFSPTARTPSLSAPACSQKLSTIPELPLPPRASSATSTVTTTNSTAISALRNVESSTHMTRDGCNSLATEHIVDHDYFLHDNILDSEILPSYK